jgi:pimeloyl-ACP methyl ester carboxylesterase
VRPCWESISIAFKKTSRKSKYTSYYSSYRGSYCDEIELDITKVVDKLLEEKKLLVTDIKKLWRKYIDLLKIDHLTLFDFMEEKYYLHFWRAVKKRTITREIENLDIVLYKDKHQKFDAKANKRRAEYMEFQLKETARGLPFVRKLYQRLFSPIFIEEIYYPPNYKEDSEGYLDETQSELQAEKINYIVNKPHLVFLLHGYLGGAEDLEKVHNVILQKWSDWRILSLKSVADDNSHTIEEMGEIIADEMIFEIEKAKTEGIVTKITLIGHSLGGLIFRAALPYLRNFKEMFHSYISLATPHLGYFDSGNKLLSLGMWLVGGVKGTPSLNEIRLIDAKSIEETALYRLSKARGLNWFKTVILAGSTQDCYSPIESALIQLSERLEGHGNMHKLKNMHKHLIKKLQNWIVHKINVNFLISEGSIDTYIGRKAHIQFIDNSELLKMIVHTHSEIF